MKTQAARASLLCLRGEVETSYLCVRKHALWGREDIRDPEIDDGNLPPDEGPVQSEEAYDCDPSPISVPWRSDTASGLSHLAEC